jgi:hypothetical protein
MNAKSNIWVVVLGIITGALANWRYAYDQLNFFENKGIWLVVILGSFLGSLAAMLLKNIHPFRASGFIWIGIITSVFLRILYDILFYDSISHNLFPFEILIYYIVSYPSALLGAYLIVIVRIVQVKK